MKKKGTSKNNRRDFLKVCTSVGAGLIVGKSTIAAAKGKDKILSENLSFFEVLEKRVSVRKYKSTPVPQEHITKILNAARLAPNSGNQQAWRFLVVQDRKKLDLLKEAGIKDRERVLKERGEEVPPAEFDSIKEYFNNYLSAPVYILVLMDKTVRYPQYSDKDGALVAGYLILAARALGYGSLFCTDSIPEEICKKVFNIPDHYSRTCIIPIGIPISWPERPERKKLEELVFHEKIGG